VRGDVFDPVDVIAYFWDPALDVGRSCKSSTRVGGRALTQVLVGMEFREAAKGAEGAAQRLLAKARCRWTARFVTRSQTTDAVVSAARFDGRRLALEVSLPKVSPDLVFDLIEPEIPYGPPDADVPAPLTEDLRLVANTRGGAFDVRVRERATGAPVGGATLQIRDRDGRQVLQKVADATGFAEIRITDITRRGTVSLYASKEIAAGEILDGVRTIPVVTRAPGTVYETVAGWPWRCPRGAKDACRRMTVTEALVRKTPFPALKTILGRAADGGQVLGQAAGLTPSQATDVTQGLGVAFGLLEVGVGQTADAFNAIGLLGLRGGLAVAGDAPPRGGTVAPRTFAVNDAGTPRLVTLYGYDATKGVPLLTSTSGAAVYPGTLAVGTGDPVAPGSGVPVLERPNSDVDGGLGAVTANATPIPQRLTSSTAAAVDSRGLAFSASGSALHPYGYGLSAGRIR